MPRPTLLALLLVAASLVPASPCLAQGFAPAFGGERPAPPPTVRIEPAPAPTITQVSYRSEEPGVVLLHRSGTRYVPYVHRYGTTVAAGVDAIGIYSPLCRSACTLELPAGRYTLALGTARGGPIEVGTFELGDRQRGRQLVGHFESRRDLRDAGVAVWALSFLGSLGVAGGGLAAWLGQPWETRVLDEAAIALFIGGGAMFLVSLVVGLPLACLSDRAALRFD